VTINYRLADSGDAAFFEQVADGVFDKPVDPKLLTEFLSDQRHHIAVADDDGIIVGFVSAVDYLHPDKVAQLWLNEVGVAPSYQGRGIGKALMELMIDHARSLGCSEAWVLTDANNEAANAVYRASGGTPSDQIMYSFPLS
jgi:ribosomal protein S18 acetylase RimI-like enzyme